VRLDPVSLRVVDFFTPGNHLYLNAADLDLGGSGPMLVPNSDWVVGGGKQGVMYVWRRHDLGHFTQNSDPSVTQEFPTGIIKAQNDTGNDMPGGALMGGLIQLPHAGHIMGGPVYWPRSASVGGVGGARLFNLSEFVELRAYAVDPAATPPIRLPAERFGPDIQEGHPGGILTLSAHGEATGIVWAATYDATGTEVIINHVLGPKGGALQQVVPGTLRAYDAETLLPLWTSDVNAARDALGKFTKFTPPTVADGRVYMATFSDMVQVYGMLDHAYARPADAIAAVLRQLLLDGD
jgi:hypothetical protein